MLLLIGLFVLVALAGAVLAVSGSRGRYVRFGWLHGVVALIAIVLLVMHDVIAPHNLLVNSASVLFVLTATGGLLLFLFRTLRQPLPGVVVVLHAGFALAAILLLCIGFVRG